MDGARGVRASRASGLRARVAQRRRRRRIVELLLLLEVVVVEFLGPREARGEFWRISQVYISQEGGRGYKLLV